MSQSGSLNFGVIGNGRVAALLDERGRIVWWCFPRFDADPVFCSLLAKGEEKGFCDVLLIDDVTKSEARYVRNTPIIETIISNSRGNSVRVTDFVPRFTRFERVFHPPQIIRRIEPVSGLPRVKI